MRTDGRFASSERDSCSPTRLRPILCAMTDPISRLDVSREDLYAIEVELGEAGMATVSKSPRVMRTHLSGLLTFVLVNLAGCGGTTDPSVATTVILSRWFEGTYRTQPDPEATTLSFSSFGDTQQLIATAWDQNGARISGAPVTWDGTCQRQWDTLRD